MKAMSLPPIVDILFGACRCNCGDGNNDEDEMVTVFQESSSIQEQPNSPPSASDTDPWPSRCGSKESAQSCLGSPRWPHHYHCGTAPPEQSTEPTAPRRRAAHSPSKKGAWGTPGSPSWPKAAPVQPAPAAAEQPPDPADTEVLQDLQQPLPWTVNPACVQAGVVLVTEVEANVFESVTSWNVIGHVCVGQQVIAAGRCDNIDGYPMVPLVPTGVADFNAFYILHEYSLNSKLADNASGSTLAPPQLEGEEDDGFDDESEDLCLSPSKHFIGGGRSRTSSSLTVLDGVGDTPIVSYPCAPRTPNGTPIGAGDIEGSPEATLKRRRTISKDQKIQFDGEDLRTMSYREFQLHIANQVTAGGECSASATPASKDTVVGSLQQGLRWIRFSTI